MNQLRNQQNDKTEELVFWDAFDKWKVIFTGKIYLSLYSKPKQVFNEQIPQEGC